MTARLDGIHALITGAASGIGAACARRMTRDGAQLLLADLNGAGAKALADELGQTSVEADVTRAGDIERMLDLAYQRWGASTCCSTTPASPRSGRCSSSARTNGTACWRSTCVPSFLCCKPPPNACVNRRRLRVPNCAES